MAAGPTEVRATLQGTVVDVAAVGAAVAPGAELVVIESMKMLYPVVADAAGTVADVRVAAGSLVQPGDVLLLVDGRAAATAEAVSPGAGAPARAPGEVRPDLAEAVARHDRGSDAARPEAVERRHAGGRRTARENVADLCDPDSFVEYGPLVVAAQRQRRSLEELIDRTPADGVIVGLGRIAGRPIGVVAYDYTVLAGTQGFQGHRKQDRLFAVAARSRLPLVIYAEGGGGRPGETDHPGVAGLDVPTFAGLARLSGLVPLVGIVSGRCYAGNAALLGLCDVIIATADANIGMGGPAMIEGGGLGVYAPEEIGPIDVQTANGVVDLAVADEAEATAAERTALVRHVSRLFMAGANLDVPAATIVLRKGYGLGSMTMAAGGFKEGLACVAWPTGEFGGMGLEGAVRLGFRRELEAIADPVEREGYFAAKLAALSERGKATSAATAFEIDDVIDPADSRRWITATLTAGLPPAAGPPPGRPGKKRPFIDTW